MIEDRTTRPGYAIGLVLYYPNTKLLDRVNLMARIGFRIFIFDNTPGGGYGRKSLQETPGALYLTAGKNVGIAFSLSTLCATAHAEGFEYLLFLDQDTLITGKTLKFIANFTKSLSIATINQYAALVFNGDQVPDHYVKNVRLAIGSGSLYNLNALKQIGWHNEKYFVDCVDYELCLRARRCGYKIGLIANTPDFDHLTEQPDQKKQLFGKNLLVRRYSATRIKDALFAYGRLILTSLYHGRLRDMYFLMKSMALYILGQILSRTTRERSVK